MEKDRDYSENLFREMQIMEFLSDANGKLRFWLNKERAKEITTDLRAELLPMGEEVI